MAIEKIKNWAKWAELAVLFSSKTGPRILIFSMAMGAKPSIEVLTMNFHLQKAWTSLSQNLLKEIALWKKIKNSLNPGRSQL